MTMFSKLICLNSLFQPVNYFVFSEPTFPGKTNKKLSSTELESLINSLTQDERLTFFSGIHNSEYVGEVPGVHRVGIPPIRMSDGPQGFRVKPKPRTSQLSQDHSTKSSTSSSTVAYGHQGTSTAFPSNLGMAASFDEKQMSTYAQVMASEFRLKGSNMILGPGVNLLRVPLNGRGWEYLSGEDGLLGARMAMSFVNGSTVKQRLMTSVKHFVNNEQEWNRKGGSVRVPEGIDEEYYYRPFEAAIRAGASSVMCSYNRIEGVYSCENSETLRQMRNITDRFFVVSDWLATKADANTSLTAGLSVEMPFGENLSVEKLKEMLDAAGKISDAERWKYQQIIDYSIRRVLYAMNDAGQFYAFPNSGNILANATDEMNGPGKMAAMLLVHESLILLKNDLVDVPVWIDPSKKQKMLPMNMADSVRTVGCGGKWGQGTPKLPNGDGDDTDFAVIGGGSGAVVPSYTPSLEQVLKDQHYYDDNADIVITCLSAPSKEGIDRVKLKDLKGTFPPPRTERKKNEKWIVFVSAPGPFLGPSPANDDSVEHSWVENSDAILFSVYSGEQISNGLVNILYGLYSPNGKLPFTLPNKENEQGFSKHQYPGVEVEKLNETLYSEGGKFGYRYYDAEGITPAFGFGHGMPYGVEMNDVKSKGWFKKHKSVRICVYREKKEVELARSGGESDIKFKFDARYAGRSVTESSKFNQAKEVFDSFKTKGGHKKLLLTRKESNINSEHSGDFIHWGRLTLQLYIQHKSRPYKELLHFQTLPIVKSPGMDDCHLIQYGKALAEEYSNNVNNLSNQNLDPSSQDGLNPFIWDAEKKKMVESDPQEFRLFYGVNGGIRGVKEIVEEGGDLTDSEVVYV